VRPSISDRTAVATDDRVRDYYRDTSDQYWRETFESPSTVASFGRDERASVVRRMIAEQMKQPGLVVDLGCGPAQLARSIHELGHSYVGLDLVPEMFRPSMVQLRGRSAHFVGAAVENTPLATGCADGIVCSAVIEYTKNPRAVLVEIHRTLKRDGSAIVTFPNALNPIHAVRALVRPVVAPIARAFMPRLKRTVFASTMIHHVFRPADVVGMAKALGFETTAMQCHGFVPSPWNHRLPPWLERLYAAIERLGQRWCPSRGSDCVVCFKKT
jgi:SAM-dependent methyltransferase